MLSLKLCPCLASHCMFSFKFWRNKFIQASAILFMPIAFCYIFFSPRHFTEVASIIAPCLAASQRWVWWSTENFWVALNAVPQGCLFSHLILCNSLVLMWLYHSATLMSFDQEFLRTLSWSYCLNNVTLNWNLCLAFYSYSTMVVVCVLGLLRMSI